MPAFDASSILHGWINYPLPQFPKLWAWVGDEVAVGHFTICKVALDETGHRAPDCHKWLKEKGIQEVAITQGAISHALVMKAGLGIVNDHYHPSGVDENDLLIIGSAKESASELVSNEARQPALPVQMLKYKIPAVCAMGNVNVPCIDFLELLTRSGKSFG